MVNNAIHWVLAGVFLVGWYMVGHTGYYSDAGAISDGYWAATILTVALMRG